MKQVQNVIHAQKVNMGGILLDQPLPVRELDMLDPFLLIHHWKSVLPGGQSQQQTGVGPHPHRGFSPVSLIFKGAIHHQDSEGNNSVISAGGTQWMNAGSGITHSERPAKELAEAGGDFEFIQFWVNTPAKHKMEAPLYQPLTQEGTPHFLSPDGKAKISVVAGELNGVSGLIKVHSPLLVLRLEIQADADFSFDVPEHFNTLIYQLNGQTQINGARLGDKDMVVFKNNTGNAISIKSTEPTTAIVLAGEPLNEPVASYGPFVMNTRSEIMAAIEDAQSGKMGELVEAL